MLLYQQEQITFILLYEEECVLTFQSAMCIHLIISPIIPHCSEKLTQIPMEEQNLWVSQDYLLQITVDFI